MRIEARHKVRMLKFDKYLIYSFSKTAWVRVETLEVTRDICFPRASLPNLYVKASAHRTFLTR
jgi:hypothetical protein